MGRSLAAAPQGWRAPRRGPEAGAQEVPPPLPWLLLADPAQHPPSPFSGPSATEGRELTCCSPAQRCQHAHPAPSRPLRAPGSCEAVPDELALSLALPGEKAALACSARVLVKGKNRHPTQAMGRASLPSAGSACAHLGSALATARCPSFSHTQGHSMPVSPCLLPRKPQSRKDEDVLKGHLV